MTTPAADGTLLPQLAELIDRLVADYDLTEVLQTLVERSVELFGADAAGLLMAGASGQLQVMAATDATAEVLELFQLQHGEGPCLEAFETGDVVLVENLSALTGRWPRWVEVAQEQGIRAVVAIPLVARGETFGAMNMFSRGSLNLQGDALVAARILTNVAAVVIVHERSRRSSETLIEQLESALSSRVVIEQAKGVVSERLGVSLEEAFRLLRTHARDERLRIALVADDVVQGRRHITR